MGVPGTNPFGGTNDGFFPSVSAFLIIFVTSANLVYSTMTIQKGYFLAWFIMCSLTSKTEGERPK